MAFPCAPPARGLFCAVWSRPGLHTELGKSNQTFIFPCLPFSWCPSWNVLDLTFSGLPGLARMSLVEGADAMSIKSCCRCLKHGLGLLDSSLVPTEGTVHLCLTFRLRWRRVCVLAEPDSRSLLLRGRKFQQLCRAGSGEQCCSIYQHSSVSSETILKAFSFG